MSVRGDGPGRAPRSSSTSASSAAERLAPYRILALVWALGGLTSIAFAFAPGSDPDQFGYEIVNGLVLLGGAAATRWLAPRREEKQPAQAIAGCSFRGALRLEQHKIDRGGAVQRCVERRTSDSVVIERDAEVPLEG